MAKATTAQRRLRSLGNNHKWFVGGGRRILWAPEFPVFLEHPGFWDPGTYLEIKLGSLFTYTLLENGHELPWQAKGRHWQPDALTSEFSAERLDATEIKTLTLDDAFNSELTLRNRTNKTRTIDVILWGRVDATDTGDIQCGPVSASRRRIRGNYLWSEPKTAKRHDLRLEWTLSAGRKDDCTSYAVQNSELTGEIPDWRVSPFYELFDNGLPNSTHWQGGIEHRPDSDPHRKWVFIALHRRIRLAPRGSTTLNAACRVSAPKATPKTKPAVGDWEGFFADAPQFRCADPYFERYFDYRLYGLRLNAIDYGRPPLRLPCVFEGINPGWFRHQISYSSQILAKDCRWLRDPALARGSILNFIEAQDESGFIHGALLSEQAERSWHAGLMYHSDWGGAVLDVYNLHPDRGFLKTCYAALSRHAEWFDRERDTDGTGLYDICNQAETGQEYMSRYLFVDPRADEWGPFRLKGVDATVYVYKLQSALSWMATELRKPADARNWKLRAQKTADAVLTKMWDPRRRKFCDVDPRTGKRSPVRAATDFYPFFTDLATEQHLPALYEHLFDPKAFWTEWPVPATALDDKHADAYGRWIGKRMCCPWNGRTWLMTNSHIAEALANAALTLDAKLEPYAVTFLTRFIQMMFVDRDLDRPTSYEYYNPITGQAPFFRATDDYMHSYVIDLIIRYVVGLQPQLDGSLIIEPLQFGLEHFSLDNCFLRGEPVSVKWDGKRLSARVGTRRQQTTGWGRLAFEHQ